MDEPQISAFGNRLDREQSILFELEAFVRRSIFQCQCNFDTRCIETILDHISQRLYEISSEFEAGLPSDLQ